MPVVSRGFRIKGTPSRSDEPDSVPYDGTELTRGDLLDGGLGAGRVGLILALGLNIS